MNTHDKKFLDVIRIKVGSLKYITSFADAAQALSKHRGHLDLRDLTRISSEQAKVLSNKSGDSMWLDGLTYLSDEAAEYLGRYRGCLYLNGLQSISDSAAEALCHYCQYGRISIEFDMCIETSEKVDELFEEHECITLESDNFVNIIDRMLPKSRKNINNITNLDENPTRNLWHFFSCPYCDARLKIQQVHEKTMVRCTACNQTFNVKP
jgi:hypothetical protein